MGPGVGVDHHAPNPLEWLPETITAGRVWARTPGETHLSCDSMYTYRWGSKHLDTMP